MESLYSRNTQIVLCFAKTEEFSEMLDLGSWALATIRSDSLQCRLQSNKPHPFNRNFNTVGILILRT